MQGTDNFEIQKYVRLFLKYKWHGLIPAGVLMAGLLAASSFLPKVYESTCVVEIEQGSIENPLRSQIDRPTPLRDHLSVFSESVLKWDNLSAVVSKVGAEKIRETSDVNGIGKLRKWLKGDGDNSKPSQISVAQEEAIAGALRRGVSIRPRPPRFLQISYQGTISDVNSEILNTLVTTLIEENQKVEQSHAGRSYEFLKTELDSYRQKLEESETKLREFREQHVTELPNNINIHLNQLTADQSELLSCDLELQELAARTAYIDEELERQNELIVSEVRREANPMLVVLSERIVDMEIELTRLRTNYTDLHPRVVELTLQLEDLKKQEEKLETSTVDTETSMLNPMHQQLMQDRQDTVLRSEVLRNRIENLRKRVAENEERVRGVPAQEQELVTLTRNYEVNESIYNMFLESLEEAKIQAKLATEERNQQSFKVLQYARAGLSPVAPNMLRVLMAILMLGAGTAVGIIFLFDFFDDSLNSVEEAKSLIKKPLLGTIPSLEKLNRNGPAIVSRLASKKSVSS